jgi:hypothetical protein
MKLKLFPARVFFGISFLLLFGCEEQPTNNFDHIDMPEGFVIEELFSPTEAGYGSWVSLAEGPNEKMYACDQYGDIYSFHIPLPGEKIKPEEIDSVEMNIGYAHGLLWAFNSLYVVVVKSPDEEHPEDPSSGVYKLQDLDGDGKLDQVKKILALNGSGEHGPHSLRVSPDGESIYLIAGNFNEVPEHFNSLLPKTWEEDNLFPPYLDARGHAVNLKAPGGWIARSDPEGNQWELVAAGMRNPFGFGFNVEGELFAYDADMEWDFGMPWYRPTRILHITSGAEYGWRTGSGKWPEYFPDNLPSVVDMAQGSPTAVVMGQDLAFPEKYRKGLFACDWSFGTIYHVDLDPDGSSYKGKKTEFLTGTPLPISNAIAGTDGNLYFLTGGRRLHSALYRVSYDGNDPSLFPSHSPGQDHDAAALRSLRKSLELHHGPSESAVETAWPHLSHDDRFVRYAARVAIEHQPMASWTSRLWREKDQKKLLYGALAYARSGGAMNERSANALDGIIWDNLSQEERISLLRVYQLLLARMGGPVTPHMAEHIISHLGPHFPSEDAILNKELAQVLLFVEAPGAVQYTMDLLRESGDVTPDQQSAILDTTTLATNRSHILCYDSEPCPPRVDR